MHHLSLKRVLVVALLAGGLALAGATQVYAAPIEPSQGLWRWLTRVWEGGVTVLWERLGAGHASSPKPAWQKQGVCIDPNGCSPNSVTPAAGPRCNAWT